MSRNKTAYRHGIALITALLFLAVFSALSIGFLSMCSANTQIAVNQHLGNNAFCSALSGYEILRYLASGILVYGTDPSGIMHEIYVQLNARIQDYGMTCVDAIYDEASQTVTVSSVPLDLAGSKTFAFVLQQDAALSNSVVAIITGTEGEVNRTISIHYTLGDRGHGVFDYGIATKGPLLMSGQTSVLGVNLAVESDVYIDTNIVGDSFSISNQAQVQGDVKIVNQYASYSIGNNSSVGGATGQEAEDHIIVGVDSVEFPDANPLYFKQFATGPVINKSTPLNPCNVLENVTIAANTNPTFASDTIIKGVLYIEQPNKVKFSGKTYVQGIIAAESAAGETSTANSLEFSGQVVCLSVSSLIGSKFDAIRNQTGTFLMAPGFFADFTGQTNIINGVMAVGGIRFTGLAGGTINGSIINYANIPVVLQGQSELNFNRSGTSTNPAGFTPVKILGIDQSTYNEI